MKAKINKFAKKITKDPKIIKRMAVNQIVTTMSEASDSYYNTDKPILTDKIYDLLEARLKTLNPEHPLLKSIGAPVQNNMEKVKLPFFMPSLDKLKGEDDSVKKWIKSYKGPYVVLDKMDGVSLLIVGTKKGWRLFTRGNGFEGQDISHLTRLLKLPTLKDRIAIRAELLMDTKIFESKYKNFAENPRNFVSGLIRRKNPNVEPTKDISIIAYELISNNSSKPSVQLLKLKKLGFQVAPYKKFEDITSESLTKYLEKRKKETTFEIDGLVISQNKKYNRVIKGNPSYSKAFKTFSKQQTAVSTVLKVVWNASRWGLLKPIIKIKPVKLGGVTISNLTGFNAYFIKHGHGLTENKPTKPVGKGAQLLIVRSGDVIPFVHDVIKGTKAEFPDTEYVWNKTKIDIALTKANSTVAIKQITYFFRAIGVEYFSIGLVTRFYKAGLNNIIKIIRAPVIKLITIDGIQKTMARKIKTGIKEALKGVDLHILMYASSKFNRNLGSERLKLVVDRYPDVMSMEYANLPEKIEDIHGFSKILAVQFVKGLPRFKLFMERIDQYVTVNKQQSPISNLLENEVIVFTGFRNDKLKKYIRDNGGKVTNTVSFKTTKLVVKDDTTNSTKVDKAKFIGVKILTVSEFLQQYEYTLS